MNSSTRERKVDVMVSERIVRCSDGHLYTAKWMPLVSVRSLRLGAKRLARCPIDRRWRLTETVQPAELSDAEVAKAQEHHAGIQ